MYQFLLIVMFLLSVFLIMLILVQRGRGGGLVGALGGMGGSSAFGTKAGDVFTRITVIVTAIWLLLCVGVIKVLNSRTAADPAAAFGVNDPRRPNSVPQGGVDARNSLPDGADVTPPGEGSNAAEGTGDAPAGDPPAGDAPAGDAPAGDPPTGDAPAEPSTNEPSSTEPSSSE